MSATIIQYLNLVPSANRTKPNFIAVLSTFLQPFADITETINSIPFKYDVDVAVGDQLDKVGEWVGQSRNVTVPLTGVYFSFGIAGVGWNQGTWKRPTDPDTGLSSLPDGPYRLLLKAKIGANYWDGTIPDSNRIWNTLFGPQGITVLTFDNQDMTMTIGIVTNNPLDAVTQALFKDGYLMLKPAGVRITGYVIPGGVGPFFGFNVNNAAIGGWNIGAWANPITDRLGIDFVLGLSRLGYV